MYNQHTDVFVDCNMAVCQLETTENEDVHKLVLNSTDELKFTLKTNVKQFFNFSLNNFEFMTRPKLELHPE